MDVCIECFYAKRPFLFPLNSLKLYKYHAPYKDPNGEHEFIDGKVIALLCENCWVINWGEKLNWDEMI